MSEMSLLEHELGDVAEDSTAASSRSNCGIHYSVSGEVKSCFITNRFLAKVHIVFVPQWSAICVNVEECDHHRNIIPPVLVRVVFLSPISARTDALYSIKAEEENVVPPTSRATPYTSSFPLSLLTNSARHFHRQRKV